MMKFFWKRIKMNKKIRQTIFIFIIFGILIGCQTLKKGLSGAKKSKSAEEFLIEKKNPLVLPPDFSKLPTPKNSSVEEDEVEDFDLEKIFKRDSKKITKKKSNKKNSIEKSVLEKIKNN